MCRCGHELGWHNPCSKCFCPFFLAKEGATAEQNKLWREQRIARVRAEQNKE